ncbi:MAG TPA: carboxypeptidase-like regulatory domain-containing protein [Chthonomonadaceae bacterium]|nr:carboxypeptidase-like regulatory domain-containing protein [Chthonomonadaceae bacterium]
MRHQGFDSKRWFKIVCAVVWAFTLSGGFLQEAHADEHPAIGQYLFEKGPEVNVAGSVVDPDGKPIPMAHVYVFGDQYDSSPHPTLPTLELGQTLTNATGQFSLKFRSLSLASHKLCVMAKGLGTAFVIIEPETENLSAVKVRMDRERVLQGRALGPDGKPAKHVSIAVQHMVTDLGYDFGRSLKGDRAYPIEVKSDEEGLFTVHSVPKSCREIWFRVDDSRYAPLECVRHGGEPSRGMEGVFPLEEKSEAHIDIRLSAPRFVTGVVRSTGQPLADAWVGAVMSHWTSPGDSHSMALWAKTDAEGRFRIRCGSWGPNLCVYAFAPKGTPCPDWSIGPITWPEGKTVQDVVIDMPVGTLVHGRVLEKGTGKPVAGASLIYMMRREHPRTMDGESASRIYWSNEYHRRYTASDGTFEQPVADGEIGYIMVKAPNGNYVGQFTTNGDMQFDKPGGMWYIVEGFARVAPERGTQHMTLDIPLTPGRTVQGAVTGPHGEKILNGFVLRATPRHTQDNQALGNILWGEPIVDGKFAISGCDPQQVTELYFLDAEHQWGDTVRWDPASSGSGPLNIALKPCGSARIRAVDAQKKPLANNPLNGSPGLDLVIVFREAPKDMIYLGGSHIQAQAAMFDYAHQVGLKTDENGVITYPTLIPGAPYRLLVQDGKLHGQGEPPAPEIAFRVTSGETLDLGEIVVQRPN